MACGFYKKKKKKKSCSCLALELLLLIRCWVKAVSQQDTNFAQGFKDSYSEIDWCDFFFQSILRPEVL